MHQLVLKIILSSKLLAKRAQKGTFFRHQSCKGRPLKGCYMKKNNKGQTTMEYVVISALVGIICIGAVRNFGNTVKQKITKMEEKINQEVTDSIFSGGGRK
jgi:Flp pilus assembly pilin Flp